MKNDEKRPWVVIAPPGFKLAEFPHDLVKLFPGDSGVIILPADALQFDIQHLGNFSPEEASRLLGENE